MNLVVSDARAVLELAWISLDKLAAPTLSDTEAVREARRHAAKLVSQELLKFLPKQAPIKLKVEDEDENNGG